MWSDMAQPPEDGEDELRRRDFVREALTDESSDLGLMLERIHACDDTTRAVTEEVNGKARFARFRQRLVPAIDKASPELRAEADDAPLLLIPLPQRYQRDGAVVAGNGDIFAFECGIWAEQPLVPSR